MDFPDTCPGFGSGGLRFRSHLNTNGHLGPISYGHSHSTPFSNAHPYSIPNANSRAGGNPRFHADIHAACDPHSYLCTWNHSHAHRNFSAIFDAHIHLSAYLYADSHVTTNTHTNSYP